MDTNLVEQLKEEVKMLKNIIAGMPGHVYWTDKNGVYMGCNDEQAKTIGFSSSTEVVGKRLKDIPLMANNKAATKHIEKINKRVLKGESIVVEESVTKPDGTELVFLSSKRPLYNAKNQIVGTVGISIDITDRKHKERLELENETIRMLKDIITRMPGHIYWTDKNGVYLGCNNEQAQAAGFQSKEEVIGKTPKDIPWIANDVNFQERLIKSNAQILAGKTMNDEEIMPQPDGTELVFLSNKRPLYNSKNEIIGMVGVSINITERKQKEQLEVEKQKNLAQLEAQKIVKKCMNNIKKEIITTQIAMINNVLGKSSSTAIPEDKIILTKREEMIIYSASMGKVPKEIASIVSVIEGKPLSYPTINAILNKQLYPKFNVVGIGQLVEKAHALGLIPFMPDAFLEVED